MQNKLLVFSNLVSVHHYDVVDEGMKVVSVEEECLEQIDTVDTGYHELRGASCS